MKIIKNELSINTKGNTDVVDITDGIKRLLDKCRLSNGLATIFVRGSTGSLTTIEYEPNLIKDLKVAVERLIPSDIEYAHTQTWGDYNGHSHIRASLIGPSLQIPFTDKKLQLGTWQQVVFIDFDACPRERMLIIQFIGE